MTSVEIWGTPLFFSAPPSLWSYLPNPFESDGGASVKEDSKALSTRNCGEIIASSAAAPSAA